MRNLVPILLIPLLLIGCGGLKRKMWSGVSFSGGGYGAQYKATELTLQNDSPVYWARIALEHAESGETYTIDGVAPGEQRAIGLVVPGAYAVRLEGSPGAGAPVVFQEASLDLDYGTQHIRLADGWVETTP